MDQPILRTADMALRLAEIVFGETQAPRKIEWFRPLQVADDDDIWSVSGRTNPNLPLPPDMFDDQFENPIFNMYVVKADSEVKDAVISAGMKLPPEAKSHLHDLLEREKWAPPVSDIRAPRQYSPSIWMNQAFHGGIINSKDAAIQFGELVFGNHFSLKCADFQKIVCELLDGVWHVTGRSEKGSAELVFRRANAQVISLDLRSM